MTLFLFFLIFAVWWIIGRAVLWYLETSMYNENDRLINIYQFLFGKITDYCDADEVIIPNEYMVTMFWPLALLIIFLESDWFYETINKIIERIKDSAGLFQKVFNFVFGWTLKPIFTIKSTKKES